ncbi:MAG: aminoglycoside 3'-phosphotransferase [Micropruina sp.]|uniref:phosphotransferase n=1 Tax=Micropruina sp. TaxID=2737536 RepID=UPI0039E2DB2D
MTLPRTDTGYSPLAGQTKLDDIVAPAWVLAMADGRRVAPVWRNELGGITYRFGDGDSFLKVQRPCPDWDVAAELPRLAWIVDFVPAPRILDSGERDGAHWLLTSGIAGRSAVDEACRVRPELTVPALGRGLRRFHDEVPAASCPFIWSVADRVTRFGLDPAFLDAVPPLDLVVCHGDACNPNFLIGADGEVSGYVDLGQLGVADRWADLAPALLSLGWNYGPDWEPAFLDAYGIADNPNKRAFYTDLWNGVGDTLDRARYYVDR